jgi:signal transduction histidine kinase
MQSVSSPVADYEAQRLAQLKSYPISFTAQDDDFDDIARLASHICHTPIALISIVDRDHQWLKSHIGIDLNQTSREESFCNHTIQQEDILEIEDALQNNHFRHKRMVTHEPHIRFYAGAPLRNSSGYNLGSLCVIDSAPRKLNEYQREALRSLSKVAVNLLELRRSQKLLEEARLQVQAASKAKSNFLSMMSHEIKTPLNGVVGLTNIILEESQDPALRTYVETLKVSADNLTVVINDILELGQIETEKIALEEVSFDLDELLGRIHRSQDPLAKEKGLTFKVKAAKVGRKLRGDVIRLAQILNNLVGNAIKLTQKGSVELEVKILEQHSHKVSLKFIVSDTGSGIDSETHKRIFNTISNPNTSAETISEETGLGLTICLRLLQRMNSTLSLISEEGSGSAFSFVLTLDVDESQPASFTGMHQESFLFRRQKVLLVEDNEINILVASRFMQKWNLEVDVAINGQEAIRKLETHAYSLVLMDLEMPVMNGYQATKAIRASGKNFADIPIIALTASALHEIEEEAYNCGMNDFISKPFDPNMLCLKLQAYLH